MIRTALPAEAERMAALHRRARSTYYPDGLPDDGIDWAAVRRGAVERPDGQVLCVVEEGTTTGVASFRPPQDGPAGKLYQFHIDHVDNGQPARPGLLRPPGPAPGPRAPARRRRPPPLPVLLRAAPGMKPAA
ncbi:hypothetical protein GCM10010345_14880 [Streptomyces canarius]|uniref:N-acetyltransferase domain-containing protein n=1 Tax=Streptomyces canarius TaxID=285453 RepID=A0ABQ3CLM5_9ACTN|nr:hypothetical protein GCM10010345_14880 [Streptomyces canarius]